MFTGIVEEMGTVKNIVRGKNLSSIVIEADKVVQGASLGGSLAVNGACLTVTEIAGRRLVFDLMRETLRATNLGGLKPGEKVNLERALRVGDRLSGHFVTGHVDAMGALTRIIRLENYTEFQVSYPPALRPFFVSKGSVCLDGVSLTIGKVNEKYFSVYLIPFTLKMTTLGRRKEEDKLNIETDILAKYIKAG